VDERDEVDGATQTTSAGLIRLASVIAGMAREGVIDTRFGGKLLRRLDKEGRRIVKGGEHALSEEEETAMFGAIGELDLALRQRDANLLVEANARLRDTEESDKRGKPKKDAAE
jgi:hypothetical protein